jgi:hypothetical protein
VPPAPPERIVSPTQPVVLAVPPAVPFGPAAPLPPVATQPVELLARNHVVAPLVPAPVVPAVAAATK